MNNRDLYRHARFTVSTETKDATDGRPIIARDTVWVIVRVVLISVILALANL